MTLKELKDKWEDTPSFHQMVNDEFIKEVNNDEMLNNHRTWVEQNAFGFGERAFHALWKKLIDEMPIEFSFMEVGIFRGQVLTLIELLANRTGKEVCRYGVSPLSNADGHWDSDYEADLTTIHNHFGIQESYNIYKDLSTDIEAIEYIERLGPYDIVYIDGGHTHDVVTSDMRHYPLMVSIGGYLVIDDACNDLNMPWGFFQGIEDVTKAVLEWENDNFEFQFNVVHIRVYKRIK